MPGRLLTLAPCASRGSASSTVDNLFNSRAEREGSEAGREAAEVKRRKERPNTTRLRRSSREKGMTDHQSR